MILTISEMYAPETNGVFTLKDGYVGDFNNVCMFFDLVIIFYVGSLFHGLSFPWPRLEPW